MQSRQKTENRKQNKAMRKPQTRAVQRTRLSSVFGLLSSAFCLLPAHGQTAAPASFPFPLPWDDASPTVMDVSRLNPAPAGGNGAITAKNGHFYDGKGRRIRFIGVNIAGANAFPDHAAAEKVAARLHKFGVNIVRLHHMDANWAHPNLLDAHFPDSQHFDKDALDRLDYFVAQLKKNGVYANINLLVSRPFSIADGLPDADKLPYGGKIANYFFPRMIALQKQYAHDLLTHTNAYTHLSYAADPAVAVVEINNEDTLLGAYFGGSETLPDAYQTELRTQWNAWLKKKYKDTNGLKRAWTAGDKPLGPNRLQNADFSQGAERWNLELNTAPANAKLTLPDDLKPPTGANGRPVRINVTTLGTQNWHIQFQQTGLDFTEGEPYTVSFWARAEKPRPLSVYASLDTDDYHQIGLSDYFTVGTEWKKYTFDFTASRVRAGHNRLVFTLGDALGTVDLAGISLHPGVETALPENAALESASFPLGKVGLNAPGEDWINFLMDIERDFTVTMHDYLKNDLHVKANVCASQANFGGIGGAWRESRMDFVDAHAYWQHPNFPHKSWDATDWNISNTAMTREPNGGELTNLARYRVAGKAFTVSEYDHPAPNDYRAEMVPMLAAFAAVQDWDGFYLFDYCHQHETGRRKAALPAISITPPTPRKWPFCPPPP